MKLIITLLCSLSFLSLKAQDYYMLVGTYDSPKSEGIYVYKFNSDSGTATAISHVKISNPSFLAVSPDEKYVYAVGEIADSNGKAGKVSSFSFDKKTGTLTFLSQQSSEGNNPCYVTVDKTGKWVFVGNYSSGNFSILPSKKGMLGKAKQTIQHTGSGPDTARQKSPHVHGIFWAKDKYHLYVTDLGTDKIMTYYYNKKTGGVFPSKLQYEAMSAGSGPRHLDIHPNGKYVYALQELTSDIAVLRDFGNADLNEIQSISALPLYYKGPRVGSADIHVSPDGKFLYVSNRGQLNNIGIFSIDQTNGHLTLIGHVPSAGERPRNFSIDPSGKFLLVANQASDEISTFLRDAETGLLYYTIKRVLVGKPVCIKWISMK